MQEEKHGGAGRNIVLLFKVVEVCLDFSPKSYIYNTVKIWDCNSKYFHGTEEEKRS